MQLYAPVALTASSSSHWWGSMSAMVRLGMLRRAVDEDVDLAELMHEPGEEPPHALAVGHVAIERDDGGSAGEGFCGFGKLIVTATSKSDLCAGGGEAMCDCAADAGGAAGDGGDFAFKC